MSCRSNNRARRSASIACLRDRTPDRCAALGAQRRDYLAVDVGDAVMPRHLGGDERAPRMLHHRRIAGERRDDPTRNSGEHPTAGFVTFTSVISGLRARLHWARSVNVRPYHSESEATRCGCSSMAMSRAFRSPSPAER